MNERNRLLSVDEALAIVLGEARPLSAEQVPLLEGLGRVLAEDVYAEGDIPPLDNSAMDGYALRAGDTMVASRGNPVVLRVSHNLAAGHTTDLEVTPGTAMRIMTGAPIPPGADAVVPFEETTADGDRVAVVRACAPGQNTRLAGEDVRRGELALPRGREIRPQEVGMLAALGRAEVAAVRRPRVGLLATGDEIVDIEAPLEAGKIRNANSYSNAAQVLRCGGVPVLLGIARDQVSEISARVRGALAQGLDLLITSGGISAGDFDVVKKVLAAEGEVTFWQVRMRPGKPLAYGRVGGVPFLGLPGNPVAAMVSFELFARPLITRMLGKTILGAPAIEATLAEDVRTRAGFRHYLRVSLEERAGRTFARLAGEQGSGILLSMVRAQGLAVVPEDSPPLKAGDAVQVILI